MSETAAAPQVHSFQAEVSEVLSLVIHSLYSNKEIFLRELVSNASDALDKLRFRRVTDPSLVPGEHPLHIRLHIDKAAGTLTIEDTGVGMTEAELIEHLGTIAHSGTKAFLQQAQQAQQAQGDLNLIGQFGVGFYSAWLVADHVDVITRAAGSEQAYQWSSDAKQTFTITPTTREQVGTSVVLHLREDQKDYLDNWRLRSLITRYSDYVSHPIQLATADEKDDEDENTDDETVDATPEVLTWETVNHASALWRRPASEITDEQYEAFYKHLSWYGDAPLARAHFTVEGTQSFTGLLFLPSSAPFDLYDRERKNGLRLYVRRVLILENCEDLLPEYLRFVRGILDSDDLPLNVSRELLQDSRQMRVIRKALVKRVLDMLDTLATDRPDDFATFFNAFGRVLKEGAHSDFENRDRIFKLLRFPSSTGATLVSLSEYVERMQEGQPGVYYALGANQRTVESIPHLERLRKKSYEILYFIDPIDQWVADALQSKGNWEEKPLIDATSSDLQIDATDEEKQAQEDAANAIGSLTTRFRDVLGDRVAEVRASDRLDDSPACLATAKGSYSAHIERLLRQQAPGQDLPSSKRILELNPAHPLILNLNRMQERDAAGSKVNEWIELLYDQALLAEGSPIEDPARFAKRMSELLTRATSDA